MFREHTLRRSYDHKLNELLEQSYPQLMLAIGGTRTLELRAMSSLFRSGVPFNYLEARWDDYQAEDRVGLAKVMDFAKHITAEALTGGGLVINGHNGSGKSLLSYLCAIEAAAKGLRIACFTVNEFMEKKSVQYLTAEPFDELLGGIDNAQMVVIDNLNREAETLGWKTQDLFEMIEKVTGGRGNKCLVLNTNLTPAEYKEQLGGSVLSRTKFFGKVYLANKDFRAKLVSNMGWILAQRDAVYKKKRAADCFRPSRLLDPHKPITVYSAAPDWCTLCAFRTRAHLCELRLTGQWMNLESKSKS